METVRIDDNVFGTGVFFLLFMTDWSRHLPHIVATAATGNLEPFTSTVVPVLAATAVPVHWGMRRSVLCAEDMAEVSAADVRAASARTIVGPDANIGLLASCGEWPVGTVPAGYHSPVTTDVPTLVISGEEDPVLPPRRAASALTHMTRATHVVLPGVAHGPDFPGCVETLAAQFLESGSGANLDASCVAGMTRPRFTVVR
jgi:pimeloyl-ACP methyl ester carboxylesterase